MELDLKSLLGNLLLAVLILLLVARAVSFAGEVQPTPISVVESSSMEPTFSVGDLIFWRPTTIDNVREGDIVVYSSQARDGELIVHRVVEIRDENGERELITQGDANEYTDQRGPHYPEPPVTEENLLGTPVSLAGSSIRVPRVGFLWIWTSASISGAIAGGMAGGGIAMLIPILTAGIMIILTIMFISPEEGDEDEKIKRLILEGEKSHIWQIFLIIFIVFAFIIVPSTWYGSETVSMSIGVGERADEGADHTYSFASQGEHIPGNQTVENPGHVLLTHHVNVKGERSEWVTLNENSFRTSPRSNHTIDFYVEIPEDAESGTYNKEIVDHHSPFWVVYPQSFVVSVIEGSPGNGVLLLNMVTTLIFALATLLLMLFLSYLIDRFNSWRVYQEAKNTIKLKGKGGISIGDRIAENKKRFKKKVVAIFDWMRGVDVIDFDPEKPLYASLVGLIAVPLHFLNADLWTVFLLVPLASALAYHLGCRWRAEIFTSALISSGMVFMILLFIPFSLPYLSNMTVTDLTILLQSFAVILLIYVILVPLILFVSYLTVFLIHGYKINHSSHPVKELSDI